MSFKISNRCTGCTACAGVCPTGAIRGSARALHVIDPAKCIDCGACGVTCRDEAVLDARGALFTLCEPPSYACAWVDLEACTGCGWCRAVCHWDAIAPVFLRGRDGVFRVATVQERRCVACGACELECGHGAIRVLRPGAPTAVDWQASNERFLRDHGAIESPPSE